MVRISNLACTCISDGSDQDTSEISFRRVHYLVERGARVAGSGALEAAAESDRLDVVRFLLSAVGFDGEDLQKAINAAKAHHHHRVVEALLDHQKSEAIG